MSDPQSIASSYTWGQRLDFIRRKGADSVSLSAPDQLMIVRDVSSFTYRAFLWPFTMATTGLGQIPCVNLVQDYAQPADLYRLSRAFFYVPNVNLGVDYGTVPPYDDPSLLALETAIISAAYVGAQGGGSPAATIWPLDGSLNLVKRLPMNLLPYPYTAIRSICQQPNQPLLRLDAATAVSLSLPYSLELEYQPIRPPVQSLDEYCWFPDDYTAIAEEGLLYYLYKYNNDPRAGSASYSQGGQVAYSGQLAVWMGAIESAAAAERAGSVNSFTPSDSLGADYSTYPGWFA